MAHVALKDRFRDHPAFGFVDWVFRGIGQVVFQNNPISGAVILGAIFYNSWIYGAVCLFGTVISTLTALLFRADIVNFDISGEERVLHWIEEQTGMAANPDGVAGTASSSGIPSPAPGNAP